MEDSFTTGQRRFLALLTADDHEGVRAALDDWQIVTMIAPDGSVSSEDLVMQVAGMASVAQQLVDELSDAIGRTPAEILDALGRWIAETNSGGTSAPPG